MTDRLWTLDRVTLAAPPVPRLAEVSLVVRRGVTAVIGYSGAGKTSLLNLLVGYERPDGGRVTRHVHDSETVGNALRGVPRVLNTLGCRGLRAKPVTQVMTPTRRGHALRA